MVCRMQNGLFVPVLMSYKALVVRRVVYAPLNYLWPLVAFSAASAQPDPSSCTTGRGTGAW